MKFEPHTNETAKAPITEANSLSEWFLCPLSNASTNHTRATETGS